MKARNFAVIAVLAVSAAALIHLGRGRSAEGGEAPRIEFRGAARSVGGSCLVVTAGNVRFAVDCGALGEGGEGEPASVPDSLAFVVLTHAHTDHCGRLPLLRRPAAVTADVRRLAAESAGAPGAARTGDAQLSA